MQSFVCMLLLLGPDCSGNGPHQCPGGGPAGGGSGGGSASLAQGDGQPASGGEEGGDGGAAWSLPRWQVAYEAQRRWVEWGLYPHGAN